ncbi:hypothetical protein HNY73_022949 [Argiope bruennichi]|uniref:Uncharacterized protein n=1 Tax=Argiope bruennichi TaxID=94029 RepID=A0A8T0E2L6_ARGBR|nr:hypothetical protein HNY73_022949 [Argiope bruennichi]
MEKRGSISSSSPLKPDKAPAQSFSFLYIFLIVCTIVFICFYSLPLNISNSTLKPLSNELIPTTIQKSISQPLKNDEKSILNELFGEIPSTASSVLNTDISSSVSSDATETEIKTTPLTQQKTQGVAASATMHKVEDFTTIFNSLSTTNLEVTNERKDTDDSTRHSNFKNQYLDTTRETRYRSTGNKAEESTETSTSRDDSNLDSTNNPAENKKLQRKNYPSSQSVNTSTDFQPEKEFLVFSDHCKIPNIDPYHPSILKYIQESPPLECKGEQPITKTEGNMLFIDKEAVRRRHLNISEITCLYMEIGRSSASHSDNGVGLGFNHTLTNKVEIKSEFIRVVCSFINETKFYEGFHTFVHDKPEVEERCNQQNSSGYSVLIVGIDAMSRMNMHRQLKKTARYLLKDMEAVEMYGFNKVGDNTFPNLMPLLTGYDERELQYVCWNASKKNPLDKCNFAWKQFAKDGYRTFYAEDSPHMSTFNYLKAGFNYQPTDYYFRHFILVMEQILGVKKLLNTYVCVGNISETAVVLRWTEQFASHFKDRKYFSFSWINGLTHDFLNKGSAVDHLYEKLFRNLHTSGALNKTIVIVMGDHGMRWGSIRKTYIGRLEERLPMLVIALPPEFNKEHPTEAKALQLNSHRLVTPFDLHATLMNILHLDKNFTFINPDNVDEELAENYTARAKTLFQPIPEDRSCDDASIDEHWCTCENSLPVDTDDRNVKKSAGFLIDYINTLLKPVSNKCAELTLKSITDARMWTAPEEHQGHSLNDTILTIVVKVKPSGAIFEGTVRTSEPEMNLELLGTVSRLNLYGDQSACIQDAVLRKYCYCS